MEGQNLVMMDVIMMIVMMIYIHEKLCWILELLAEHPV